VGVHADNAERRAGAGDHDRDGELQAAVMRCSVVGARTAALVQSECSRSNTEAQRSTEVLFVFRKTIPCTPWDLCGSVFNRRLGAGG
jgi:hypothetical protein